MQLVKNIEYRESSLNWILDKVALHMWSEKHYQKWASSLDNSEQMKVLQ